jgi:putative toxin-antitoxin system antitoxin component (TIGR02293 family)
MATLSRARPDSLATAGNLKLAEIVRGGVPASSIRELSAEFGIGVLELADLLNLARRTVTRRLAQRKALTSMESERIVRVKRLLHKAQAVFESKEAAKRWFTRTLAVLGGKSPLELCASEPGGREVELVLGRIEHGVIA